MVAKSDHSPPQYIIYSAANTPVVAQGVIEYHPANAVIDLSALSGGAFTFHYWELNKGLHTFDAPQNGTASSAWLANPPADENRLGPHNEWMMLINID